MEERICKYPGCFYYNKKAKRYCCGACTVDHYSSEQLDSIITKIRKEKIMSKVKREYSYRTTDDKIFTGKLAKEKARSHQKRLNFRGVIKNIVPEARKIFNIDKSYLLKDEDGETNEDRLIDKINDEFSWDMNDFEDFLHYFTNICLEIPELSKFMQFVDKKFDEYK